jgi:hypothetical protein
VTDSTPEYPHDWAECSVFSALDDAIVVSCDCGWRLALDSTPTVFAIQDLATRHCLYPEIADPRAWRKPR